MAPLLSCLPSRFPQVRSLSWVFLGFFHVGQSYSCIGVDRHGDYCADSSASLAQCGFVGGFLPNFAIFALVSVLLKNFLLFFMGFPLAGPNDFFCQLRLPIHLSLSLL